MQSNITVPGLTPVESKRDGNNYEASVWNRKYTISDAPFFSSIISGGEEILAGPVRLVGTCFGKPIEWEACQNFEMVDTDGKSRTFVQTTKFRELVLNTSMQIFYDGCVKCNAKLMPKSSAISECLVLNQLWLEIPFKKESAKMYQLYPFGNIKIDGRETVGTPSLYGLGYVPSQSLVAPFKQNIYLGNDDIGMSVFFESDEGWRYFLSNRVIEVLNKEDHILLRVRFLDEEHLDWVDKGGANGGYLFPINFEFGMQATPVKPYVSNNYFEKSYHAGRVASADDGIPALDEPCEEGSDELFIDALKKEGIEILYFHELWNDMQNSFMLTDKASARLKKIVEIAHSRGIKILPYFGYEISTLSPLFNKKFLYKYKKRYSDTHYELWKCLYSRTPYQRDYSVCYASDYSEVFLEGIARLMDEYHFDGIYVDGTFAITGCMNLEHGCGYKDKYGVIHQTYDVWRRRAFIERLHEVVHSRGGMINAHTGMTFPAPTLAFADSLYDGEVIQPFLVKGTLDRVPEGHFRSLYTGKTAGVPICYIAYTNPTLWTFHQSLATIVAFNVLPRANNHLEDLKEVAKIWRIYDELPTSKAEFKPFFNNDVVCDNENVKVSYYELGGKILAVIANFCKEPTGKSVITFAKKFKTATNKMTGESVNLVDGDKITVEFDNFDYMIVGLE